MNKRWSREEVQKLFGESKNPLVQIAIQYNSTKITDPECAHYCDLYWKYFKYLKDEPIRVLEIGVKDGDSLLMWRDFFENGKIYGLEINEDPLKDFSASRTKIIFGDQTDTGLLNEISDNYGPFNIILDDASHVCEHQKISFNYLFKSGLKYGGIYVVEDLGTSYWQKWGGGLKEPSSMIEYLKELIDGLNYRFYKGGRTEYVGIPDESLVNATYFDRNISGISFHKGICFIEKGSRL